MPVGVKVPEKVALLRALSVMVAQLGLTEIIVGSGVQRPLLAEAQRWCCRSHRYRSPCCHR